MRRITYRCKKCQWEKSVVEQWGDLRPRMCGNARACKTFFNVEPDKLEVILPPALEAKPEVKKDEPKKFQSRRDKKEDEANA